MGSESSKVGSNSSQITSKNIILIRAENIEEVLNGESIKSELKGNTITDSNLDSSITTTGEREKK